MENKMTKSPQKVGVPPAREPQSWDELEGVAFRILQREGKFSGFSYKQYLDLLKKEKEIKESPEASSTSVEEVVEDLRRYGGVGSDLLVRTFISSTAEKSRKAYVAGREGNVLYFCSGNHIHSDKLELALTSCHVPGRSGGGSWGFDGMRRLAIADNWYNNDRDEDPESWMERTRALVYENTEGGLNYKIVPGARDASDAKTILYLAVESTKASLEREIDRIWAY